MSGWAGPAEKMTFEVRTAGDPAACIGAIRQAVAAVDRNLPLFDLPTQKEQIDETLMRDRQVLRQE